MAMSGFICHDDYLAKTAKLSDEEVGRLFRALMRYHATGEEEDINGRESIAFDFIREDIDRTEQAYKAKCDKNRENRLSAIGNVRQRSSTTVNVPAQKEKEKEKEKEKRKEVQEKFARFWSAYPRKESKQQAMRNFEKINPDETLLAIMLTAIERWKQTDQWQEDGGRYIPHPSTWLNNKRWEDEPPKASGNPSNSHGKVLAQDYTQRDYTEQTESLDDVLNRITGVGA